SPEGDRASLRVANRKQEAAAEEVVAAAAGLTRARESDLDEQILTDRLAGHSRQQRVPAVRRIAEAEAARDLEINAAPLEILARAASGRVPEALAVEACGEGHHAPERLELAVGVWSALTRRGHFDAGPLGERPDGLRKREAIHAHQEAQRIAARAAAEAVEDAALGIHGERRRPLRVERAEALPVVARPLQAHELADQVHDVRACANLVEQRLGEPGHQPTRRGPESPAGENGARSAFANAPGDSEPWSISSVPARRRWRRFRPLRMRLGGARGRGDARSAAPRRRAATRPSRVHE